MSARRGPHLLLKALVGVVASAAGIGVGHLIASLVNPVSSPVLSVGAAAIDLAPRPLKDFAVATFGENDKLVLIGGVGVALLVITAGLGVLAFRSLSAALVGVVLLGAVGAAAALTRGDATWLSVLPAVATVVVGGLVLRLLVRAFEGDPSPADDADDAGEQAAASPVSTLTRRRGLVLAGATGLAVVAAGGGQLITLRRSSDSALGRGRSLPRPVSGARAIPRGAMPQVDGITPFVTSNEDFYRVDVSIDTPRLNVDDWRLEIGGLVENPVTLTYQDLLDMDLIERWVTISCVSNPVGGPYVGNAKWLGVRMTDLADQVGIKKGADQWLSRSSDGYTCGTPIATMLDGRDSMLAVGMNGEQLPIAHGFPARQLVPGLLGFVSATKWVVRMDATTYAEDQAYWTRRKWATDAPTLTQTRIDVPKSLQQVPGGTVDIAGVAWAQHRGVAAVEVSVDKGPWLKATLGADAGDDVWREWHLPWQSTGPGRHDVQVRSTDKTGATQPQERTEVFPKGATGWQSISFTVGG